MRKTARVLTFLAIAGLGSWDTMAALSVYCHGGNCGSSCGSYRWSVKTLSDPDRDRINLEPVDVTIEQLVGQKPTATSEQSRAAPVEFTVYRVEARLLALYAEHDRDFHIILASPRDSTLTLIAEVPDPACAGASVSGFAEGFGRVRRTLIDRLSTPGGEADALVRVTGVGFFDYPHGETGAAPNGIELHPVLALQFAHLVR